MGSEWNTYLLEDCMDAIIDYRGKTPQKTTHGIPLITAKIIKDGAIQPVAEFIAEADYESWMRRGMPLPGDIVMTTEAPLGEVAQLDDRKIALAQRVITLRGKKNFLDNTFLKYLLISHDVQHQLDGRGTGTTVKGIKQSELRKIELRLPDFHIQKQIGHILGSLDNKITLNRQLNQTLEQMAQALFKSWFVDFDPVIDNALAAGNEIPSDLQDRAERRQLQLAKADHKPLPENIRKLFPSEFELTESLGWVPKGWGVKKAEDIAHVAIGKTPPRNQSEHFSDTRDDNVVWVSIRDMGVGGVHINDSSEYLVPESVARFNVNLVPRSSVLLSFKLTLGRVCITSCDLTTNEAIASFSAFKNGIGKEFLYCYLNSFDYGSLGSTSSIATAVNSKIIKAMPILVASELVLKQFETITGEWFSRMEQVDFENNGLIKLRDTLLPKLISGELRIPEAQAQLEEALA